MPRWIVQFFKLIHDLPGRAGRIWSLRRSRKANIPPDLRNICERYGEDVIALVLASGHSPRAKELLTIYATDETVGCAAAWLTERSRARQQRERVTAFLEVVVVCLIGWEIHLGYQQERLQSRNFKEQQQVLTNLQNSSAITAKTLASLQSTTELMNMTQQMQLDAAKKSADETARSAKAAESSASTASQAMHISERAYVYLTPSLRKPPSSGEKLQISIVIGNAGRTSALELAVHSAAAFVPSSMPVNEALDKAFAAPPPKWESVGVLPSAGTSESPADSPLALNQSDVEQLVGDKMFLYVFATTAYKDVFKQLHHTEICTIYQPKINKFMNCGEHNKSD